MHDKKVTCIIINYHTELLLIKCVQSLFNFHSNKLVEVLIVNNGGNLDVFRNLFPTICIKETGENLGFSRANNFGLSFVTTKYVCFLNSDTEFISSIFDQFIMRFKQSDQTGAISCLLLNSDKSVQANFHWGHQLWLKLLLRNPLIIKVLPVKKILNRKNNLNTKKLLETHLAEWISGCIFFTSIEISKQFNTFWDEDFFMYWEDVELSFRLRDKGYKLLYAPDLKIIHHSGGNEALFNVKRFEMMERSKLIFIQKRFGSFAHNIYIQLMKFTLRFERFLLKRKGEKVSEILEIESIFYAKK